MAIYFLLECDVCKTKQASSKPGDIGFHPKIQFEISPGNTVTLDLCADCGQELAFWIKTGDERKKNINSRRLAPFS